MYPTRKDKLNIDARKSIIRTAAPAHLCAEADGSRGLISIKLDLVSK
jgi:hypothetical protein